MAVPWADIDTLITDTLVDQNHDFFPESELLKWYDQGARRQLRQVIEAMKTRPDVDPYSNNYVAYFLESTTAAPLTVGVTGQDVGQPSDSVELLSVIIIQTDKTEVKCRRVPFTDDFNIKNYPDFAPTPLRPYWTVTDQGLIRLYFATPDTTPTAELKFQVRYIREVIDSDIGGDVDTPDPYNVGPIHYAIAKALERQQTDPQAYYDQAEFDANNILPRKVEQQAGR